MQPDRIVSLLPGATEIVSALGLEDRLIGISAECDQPLSVMGRRRVSLAALDPRETDPAAIDREVRDRLASGRPLFQADQAALRELDPDLILSQSLCDVCAATPGGLTAEAIGDAEVLALDGRDLDGLLEDIRRVAMAAGVPDKGDALIDSLDRRRQAVRRHKAPSRRVLTVEWPDPLFIGGHWIPDMVVTAGGESLGGPGDHSVVVEWDTVRRFDPEVIIMLPCGQSVAGAARGLASMRSRPGWENLAAVRTHAVYLVDGNRFFSRPGPAAFTGLELMAHILGTGQPNPAPGYWRQARGEELDGVA
ncbi:ABC transporter substrate-binding protein [Spiribacter onubensis]|uniref:ABC transporter substrate-binding protein n=1 Tax=Spiribacter onubensis TaxID=3122420 RepID=A0ABV3S6L9_9GAMM